ncbi:ABC-type transporter, periplasmic subunit family 3 [Colwellia psychrerythraea]|uniref:ABC-type transporter, periplasmic subunit family 3 n=1 Tax=Colwellia psychrerythraea TaxID=28229 RepID=A0A099L1N0_COLPS|nr:ABC-type transporter, periplasmic subunit family 3 [Colwellia psychrerythraea]
MRKCSLLFLCFITFNAYSCQLDIRLEHFSPESHKSHNDEWFGIDIDLTKALLNEADCNFNILETPWARALLMLARGEIDLMINVSKTPEREPLYYFIGPIRNEEIVFATYKTVEHNLTKVDDILKLDKPVAIQRNAYYGEAIQRLIDNEKYTELFVHVPNNDIKLKLLERGRISGFLEAKRHVIHGINNDEKFSNVWFPPLIFHKNPVYFALSKQSVDEQLINKIFNSFQRLLDQGKINEIISKHQ